MDARVEIRPKDLCAADVVRKALESFDGYGRCIPSQAVAPFLKWAGGKRWLMPIANALSELNQSVYFEPFLGSGAMFFGFRPERAVLNDANAELIETYQALRDNPDSVLSALKKHSAAHREKDYYYKVRASRPQKAHTRAARFIYLNRTCWNGLYRVNLQGHFNVPKGTKDNVLMEVDNFDLISKTLLNAVLYSGDFESIIDMAGSGDLVFADPPYTVRHQYNGFVKYNEKLFSWEDQERLAGALVRAKDRGAHILCTNADHASIRELYGSEFDLVPVTRYSAISSVGTSRGKYAEIIITG